MLSALWVSKTGLSAQDMNLTTISNNLANVSTTGFKRDRAEFQDLLYQIRRQPGGQSTQDSELPSGLQLGTGVRVVGTQKIFTPGSLQTTEQPLDMAVNGRGFFQVLLPDGTVSYTRDGSFHLNSDGQIVTSNGFALEPAIVVPNETQTFTVGQDGTVSVTTTGNAQPQVIGQHPDRRLHQPGRPAGHRQQPVPGNRLQRRAPGRYAGSQRPRHGCPEHPGKLQRQRGRGTGEHDHHPARLRDELQGHLHRRPDVVLRHPESLTGPDRALAVRREVA